jgi:tetratricopeptide (TPR) repeat protein
MQVKMITFQLEMDQLVDGAIAAKAARAASIDFEAEIGQMLADGNLSLAAVKLQKLAESTVEPNAAIKYWEQAAKLYRAEGTITRYWQCKRQVANIEAETGRYDEAIVIYEEIGAWYNSNELLKWGCQKLYLLAVACRLADGNVEAAQSTVIKYRDQIGNTREFDLARSIAHCENVDGFDRIVAIYEQTTQLEPLCKRLLMRFRTFCSKK